jgi:hypothetical protein
VNVVTFACSVDVKKVWSFTFTFSEFLLLWCLRSLLCIIRIHIACLVRDFPPRFHVSALDAVEEISSALPDNKK